MSLILYIEPAAFEVPCLSAESLAALAYLQNVAPASFLVHCTANAAALITGKLPTLNDKGSGTWTSGFAAIVAYLKKLGLDADEPLNALERAESIALQVLVEQSASDLLSKVWFGDDLNYAAVRSILGKALPVPFNYTLPAELRKRAVGITSTVEGNLPPIAMGVTPSVRSAATALSASSQKTRKAQGLYALIEKQLGDKAYLFGKQATSCDALVCGHLSLHSYDQIPNPILAEELQRSFPKLHSYVAAFKDNLRPVDLAPPEPVGIMNIFNALWREMAGPRRSKPKTEEPSMEEGLKRIKDRKEKLYFACASVLGLIGFIIFNGIISFDIEGEEDYEDAGSFNEQEEVEEELSDDELE
ncbi:hypothetical protein BCR37DRAFT_390317 [Protomyces lactucae-debilis]|uniref:Mitochondrial outer membrane transport complex Sam37/metaxin N-terminal domain-containing protein n=1 Tax=Protomyces lactucae-debilis TaxID=2754530 RepID=A0A1Y2FUX3_PROLT|nr:uncharacterized protein BCR37DRAFT_390317 [Protomyces lactucae-debilis]ORY87798.1 hypothetical protein BCR37DRAFT_390317 [Protomyces lactucae-debilis]